MKATVTASETLCGPRKQGEKNFVEERTKHAQTRCSNHMANSKMKTASRNRRALFESHSLHLEMFTCQSNSVVLKEGVENILRGLTD
jgi:hypothetical protein